MTNAYFRSISASHARIEVGIVQCLHGRLLRSMRFRPRGTAYAAVLAGNASDACISVNN